MLLLASFVMIAATSSAHARTINGFAVAEIKELIQISETQQLNFGTLYLQNGAAGIASLGVAGTLNLTNAASQDGGAVRTGSFAASGTPNTAVSISFQDGVLSGNGNVMNITNLTHDAGTTPALNASGLITFNVGADLQINENQPTGLYTGTYQVTIDYQ